MLSQNLCSMDSLGLLKLGLIMFFPFALSDAMGFAILWGQTAKVGRASRCIYLPAVKYSYASLEFRT
jgi:hypothetical protein